MSLPERTPISSAQSLTHSKLSEQHVQVQTAAGDPASPLDSDWKLVAYPLYAHVAPLQAAEEIGEHEANRQGWVLRCPVAFEAVWNGGSQPEDIQIRLIGQAADEMTAAFVQSQAGNGQITFYPGYQFTSNRAALLALRGPNNSPQDALAPLESLIDISLVPSMVVMHWQFTRPNQTVRFAADEPFAIISLQSNDAHEPVALEIAPYPAEDELEAYEQAFQQIAESAALQGLFQRLGASSVAQTVDQSTTTASVDSAQQWAAQLRENPQGAPPVSCICPTYGRVALLEEAIESFLRQDYPGPKELLILNDYAEQTLHFDHPEVRIINLPQRLPSIGEKYNRAVELAAHDLLFVWHDDDIYLPHRLSYSVAQMQTERSFFKANQAWFWNAGKLSGPDQNAFHGGSCWRRELFDQVQGYPNVNQGYDQEFELVCKVEAATAALVQPAKPSDIYYLYRWYGTGSYHFSVLDGVGPVVDYVAQQAARGEIPQGRVELQPQWQEDYQSLVQNYIATLPVEKLAVKEEIPFPPPYFEIPSPPPLPPGQAAQLFRGDYPCKISVILPAANESVLLQRTVEQFAATLPDQSEIIVVDNGSTDGCSDFLLNQAAPNIHLIRTAEALGVSGARNRGLAQAQGEIVIFADAHIDLPKNWWQPLVCALNQPRVGVVGPAIGVMGRPDHNAACGQRIAETKLRVEWLAKRGEEAYPVPTLGGGFMAMRHDTLKAAGAFDAGMPQWGSEDLEICLRYWLLGYEVWVAPSVTVLHYFRQSSPYKVEWQAVTHNLLRVALLHLSGKRLARVLAALKVDGKFEHALAHAVESDVWQKRAEFTARRAHDDNWYFEKFADSCPV